MAETPADYHHDAVRFADALQYTASATGFSARLIEKDYYCTLVLRELRPLFDAGLVFKGGTLLAKVHAGFYRLSEDLDFGVSMDVAARRADRRAAAGPIKQFLQILPDRCDALRTSDIRGQNESRQYHGIYSYRSCITGDMETIKIEVSFREPIVDSTAFLPANTILVNPLLGTAALAPVSVRVLSLREAYAEKARAALSRREPAVRDFYDIHFAMQKGILNLADEELLALLSRKLAVDGNEPVDLSDARIRQLRQQVNSHLQPVLRASDFAAFDLERPIAELLQLVPRLSTNA